MCGCAGGGCHLCRPPGLSTRYEDLRVRYHNLRGTTLCDELERNRRAIDLVRDVDAFIADCKRAHRPSLVTCALDLKVLIGRHVFKLDDISLDLNTSPGRKQMDSDERELERIETQMENLRKRKEEILSRPQDTYGPGTYLIAERKPEMPEYVWGPPRVYFKDEQDRWWSSADTAHPVGWGVVRYILQDERLNVFFVESLTQVEDQ